MQLGAGVSGMVAQQGKASGLGKSATDDLGLLLGPEARAFGLAHVVSAPLMSDTAPIGTLTLYRPGSRPFTEDDARLAVAVARQAAIAINNARQHELTRQSAMTDQLTGLANARHFFMRLEQELSRARREHKPVSLVAVDLNGLKQINDSYGHQQGDRALRVIAEVFRRHVRDYDTVVRYAGDEFFIILPDMTNKVAEETVLRIKEAVRNTCVEMLPGRSVNLSASFGVATFPGDAEHADALIAVADQAMYADKRLNYQAALLTAQESTKPEEEVAPRADALR
jgi:diguanylate cyclase (GGDEF)-like protein